MADLTETQEVELQPLRMAVREQGDLVRSLKEEKAPKADIDKAVADLKAKKRVLEKKEKEFAPKDEFNRAKLEDLLIRRFFFAPAFEIYGGVAGLYDYGPMGAQMERQLIQLWEQFFLIKEQLMLIHCSALTPQPVLRASGHEKRFVDMMVKDLKTGECLRADHLLEGHLEKQLQAKGTSEEKKEEYKSLLSRVDGLSISELGAMLKKYSVKSPTTGNDVSEPEEFNLMFATSIGPGSAAQKSYLRPETAQGIFLCFKRLLEFNNGRLPFGACQIGPAFRNEISPRAGLIRLREFNMAEIEYFINPSEKDHPNYPEVADLEVQLLPRGNQMQGRPMQVLRLGTAVDEGIISSRLMAYFIGRIYLFLTAAGVRKNMLRFRQHMDNEMAHYACDCWDAECKTSYGWVECVGCADRSCYDLQRHSEETNTSLVAKIDLKEPKIVKVVEIDSNKGVIGKTFKKDAKDIMTRLASLTIAEATTMKEQLEANDTTELKVCDSTFTLTREMVKEVKVVEKKVHVEDIQPNVIEPSFGIGRILYSILEQNFQIRPNDEQRTWLQIPTAVCPIKCSILPLSGHEEFAPFVKQLSTEMTAHNIAHRIDDSAVAIGRRYARTDEIAIPFGITVDFVTKPNGTVTLRERDTTKQVRIPISEVCGVVEQLARGQLQFSDVQACYPQFESQEAEGAAAACS